MPCILPGDRGAQAQEDAAAAADDDDDGDEEEEADNLVEKSFHRGDCLGSTKCPWMLREAVRSVRSTGS